VLCILGGLSEDGLFNGKNREGERNASTDGAPSAGHANGITISTHADLLMLRPSGL
jgi:hypothetical protein